MQSIPELTSLGLSKDLEKSKIGFQSNIKFLLSKDDDYTILNINSRSAYRVKNNTKYHKFFKILEREKEISTSKLYISIYSGERDKVDRDMKDKLRGLLKQTKMKPLRNRSHNLSFDYSKDNLEKTAQASPGRPDDRNPDYSRDSWGKARQPGRPERA